MIKQYIQTEILSKLEENKRKKEWKEKLMLIEAPISRFATPTSPFASFSLLLLQPSSMEVWESLKLSYEHTLPLRPDTFSILKPKTSSNRKGIAWKTEVMHKTEGAGKGKGHHGRWQPPRAGRGWHHAPWCPPRSSRGGHWPGGSSSPLIRRVLPFFLFRGLLVLGYLQWALWSCFLPLMLRLDITSHIPHKSWPETLKSARKLNKAKTERNEKLWITCK